MLIEIAAFFSKSRSQWDLFLWQSHKNKCHVIFLAGITPLLCILFHWKAVNKSLGNRFILRGQTGPVVKFQKHSNVALFYSKLYSLTGWRFDNCHNFLACKQIILMRHYRINVLSTGKICNLLLIWLLLFKSICARKLDLVDQIHRFL